MSERAPREVREAAVAMPAVQLRIDLHNDDDGDAGCIVTRIISVQGAGARIKRAVRWLMVFYLTSLFLTLFFGERLAERTEEWRRNKAEKDLHKYPWYSLDYDWYE